MVLRFVADDARAQPHGGRECRQEQPFGFGVDVGALHRVVLVAAQIAERAVVVDVASAKLVLTVGVGAD